MKIHPVGPKLFHADGSVERQTDKMILTVTFHNFVNTLQNYKKTNKKEAERENREEAKCRQDRKKDKGTKEESRKKQHKGKIRNVILVSYTSIKLSD